MKINYKIIWVEDKIDTPPFKSLLREVKKHLEDEFFNVTIETAEDYEEFKNKFEEHDCFDLIITDLNLNESHGNEVINFIRDDKHILTEIFFYSANSELTRTKLLNSSRITFHQLDGQDYHKELLRSIIGLINLTIAKFQNIVTMRGMIMHETSSLDSIMDIIVKDQLNDPNLAESLAPALKTILDNIFKSAESKYNRAKKRNAKEILKDTVLFNSSQKVLALGEILNYYQVQNFAHEYSDEVILIRNQFAHVELLKDESGKEYFKVKGEEVIFDKDFCRQIRKNISKHAGNLNRFKQKLANK